MNESLFTNEASFGGNLKSQFRKDLAISTGLYIATGYFGADLISAFESDLVALGSKGPCKIFLGMVYHGGVRPKQLASLRSIDEKLRRNNPDNGVYISRKEYHGKVYKFIRPEGGLKIFIGSSNFSPQGFETRQECNIEVESDSTKLDISNYIYFLFNQDTTEKLSDVELYLRTRKAATPLNKELDDCAIKSSEYPHNSSVIGVCNIKLRVDSQPKSSLNLFFDKGRKNKKNGKYSPRPWYEVELTATSTELRAQHYPKSQLKSPGKMTKIGNPSKSREGEFVVYAEDNGKYYRIDMKVHADNGKNISSAEESGGRSTLGRLIKGKLERNDLLNKGERITSETLHEYGNDTIQLKKISEKTYILEF